MDTLSRDDDRLPRAAASMPQLYVLIECDRPQAGSSRHVLAELDRVELVRGTSREHKRADRTLVISIPDARMSAPHARLVRRDGAWSVEDAGSKNGVFVDGERCDKMPLVDGTLVEIGHTLLYYREAPPPLGALDREGSALRELAPGTRTFVPALARGFADLAVVARTAAAILIHGETGTGKELAARAVHALAGRSGAFVAVNCGALPATLVESELYGYRRGAFSGAEQDRPGLVRSADGGTLFLDEIADLPLASQAALLRVLQEREVTPLGATQPMPVDLHVVAASHEDLAALVERGDFRRDLYARLAAFTLRLPPLRERREDVGELLARMLPADARLTCAAARALVEHDWPLNVRELDSCLTIAIALAEGGQIRLEHLPPAVREPPVAPAEQLAPEDLARRGELEQLLRQHAGNVSAVARATGKARAQIHRWLRRYRLDPETFR